MAYVDPTTQDLVLTLAQDVRGVASVEDTAQRVYHRLFTQRGSCFWDRSFGSTLHELGRAKIGRTFQADVEDRVRRALQPLVDDGSITAIAFAHERAATGRWHVQVQVQDRRHAVIPFDLWVGVA